MASSCPYSNNNNSITANGKSQNDDETRKKFYEELSLMHKKCQNEEVVFPDYNGIAKCKWSLDNFSSSTSPHEAMPRPPSKTNSICDSVLDAIGNTPMVRLSRFKQKYNLKCDLVAKCEFFSAGGSVKDRISKRMVEEAEKSGQIKPGDVLIEPTSGNTGIGLALAAAVKGYKLVITLPEKMSDEKLNIMKLLGAEILRTPTEAAWNSPDSHIGLALKLQKCMKNAHILDQYKNPSNPLAHYETTAEEIIEQCDGKVDMVVMTAGTGGTVTGIARKIKEKMPQCTIVGVDPYGSILALPEELNEKNKNVPYKVEGIGYDFIPTVLDRQIVDEWVKTEDEESFLYARELILLEGLLCGGSSGAAMKGVLEKARSLNENQRCVVVLPDSCRNYMSKFISDKWMKAHGFLKEDIGGTSPAVDIWGGKAVSDLKLSAPITVLPNVTISECVHILYEHGIDQVPVVKEDGEVIGVISEGNVVSYLNSGRISINDDVTKAMYKTFQTVQRDCPLREVSVMLDVNPFVLVTSKQNLFKDNLNFLTKQIILSVVTRIDLLRFLNQQQKRESDTI